MNKVPRLIPILLMVLSLGSCGLMDLESDDIVVAEMKLNMQSAYIMVGDTLEVSAVFNPDTVTVPDLYWSTSNDSVLAITEDGKFVGCMEGRTTVTAISVSYQHTDSCHVIVLPRWEIDYHEYPHSMVVYAEVSAWGGRFDTSTMMLSAWVGDELRGVGVMKEWNGQQYMEIRVYSLSDGYDADAEENVSFRLYDKRRFTQCTFPQKLKYDGETHGSVSDLFRLTLE